jgi:hypothetical protein
VRDNDGADDGQAKPHAAAPAHPVGAEPPEGLEEDRYHLGGHVRAGVTHDERRPGRLAGYFHLNPAARLVVLDRIRHQVGDQPLKQHLVAGRPRARQLAAEGHHRYPDRVREWIRVLVPCFFQ